MPAGALPIFLLVLSTAAADDVRIFSAVPGSTKLSYRLVHKMHTVVGTATRDIEGKARIAGGTAQVMIRVPAENFDSGNSNRDVHMKETVEATRYPWVELKAVGEVLLPDAFPKVTRPVFKGKLTFHGVTQTIELPIALHWRSGGEVEAEGAFSISLEAFKIERPSLLMIKVDDKLDIDLRLLMRVDSAQ